VVSSLEVSQPKFMAYVISTAKFYSLQFSRVNNVGWRIQVTKHFLSWYLQFMRSKYSSHNFVFKRLHRIERIQMLPQKVANKNLLMNKAALFSLRSFRLRIYIWSHSLSSHSQAWNRPRLPPFTVFSTLLLRKSVIRFRLAYDIDESSLTRPRNKQTYSPSVIHSHRECSAGGGFGMMCYVFYLAVCRPIRCRQGAGGDVGKGFLLLCLSCVHYFIVSWLCYVLETYWFIISFVCILTKNKYITESDVSTALVP
jgi:hypothetical protein